MASNITNDYLTALSIDQKSEFALLGKNQGVPGLDSFLEALDEKPHPFLFQLLDTICIPWLVVPSPHLQNQQYCISLSLLLLPHLSLSLTLKGSSPLRTHVIKFNLH